MSLEHKYQGKDLRDVVGQAGSFNFVFLGVLSLVRVYRVFSVCERSLVGALGFEFSRF